MLAEQSDKALAAVRQFRSETDEIRESPEPLAIRLTVFVLAGLLLSAVVFMCLTRVDRVVTGPGTIMTTQRVNVFQALDRSIIQTLDVREGEQVEKGQLLATLDGTFAVADVQQLRQQIASLEAQISRQEAELNTRELIFEPASDPDRLRYQTIQKGLFDQRSAQYKAQLESFDAKISQVEATHEKFKTDQKHYAERVSIAKKVEGMRTTLAESGSGSQLNMLLSQDVRLEIGRSLDYTRNSLLESEQALASLRSDRRAFVTQWLATLSQESVTARNSLDVARAQLDKAEKHKDLVRLTAAEPSVVLTMAKLSVGSVLKEGDPLFTLMPVDTRLEAEARIASRDVGFVRVGDPCLLKIDAFNYMEHGSAEGRVRWISEGAFTVDDSGKVVDAFYKMRCSVDQTRFINVPDTFRLIPGMTLTADANVGTRSLMMYLLRGMLRGFNESMREP